MPTLSIRREGNTGGRDIASTHWTCEVKDLRHAWNLHAREPGDPTNARHEAVGGPVEEGNEPQSRHERWRSEEHTSELQSRLHLGCRLLLGNKESDQNLEPRVRLPTQPGQTQEPDPSAGRNPSRFRLSAAVRTSSVRDELRPDGSH